MPTSTFTIPEDGTTVVVGSSGRVSNDRLMSSRVDDVYLELYSTGQWDARAGTGYFHWGMEKSTDGGTNWTWLVHTPGDGADPSQLVIGQRRAKDGGMPDMGISGAALTQAVGARVRLRAFSIPINSTSDQNPTVRVGCHVTVRT